MSSYITNQDLIDRVGNDAAVQLTTDSGSTVDDDVITEVVNSSEGEVNGYLARRYKVPVDLSAHADLAGTLKGFTLDIAEYRLRSRRQPVSDGVRTIREDAIKWLTAVSEGKVVLPAGITPASTTSDSPMAVWGASPATASRENMGVGGTNE